MQQLSRLALVACLGSLLLQGCSGGDGKNAAGSEANTGKAYTKADADAAQPARGAPESGK